MNTTIGLLGFDHPALVAKYGSWVEAENAFHKFIIEWAAYRDSAVIGDVGILGAFPSWERAWFAFLEFSFRDRPPFYRIGYNEEMPTADTLGNPLSAYTLVKSDGLKCCCGKSPVLVHDDAAYPGAVRYECPQCKKTTIACYSSDGRSEERAKEIWNTEPWTKF